MAKKSYNKPTLHVHGSMKTLTQVIGTTQQDFINGVSNNDTGTIDLVCNQTGCQPVP